MTQELLANMLGIRRDGVTQATGRLQREGIINYSHCYIAVLASKKLEKHSCDCYKASKAEFDRLLPVLHGIAFDTGY